MLFDEIVDGIFFYLDSFTNTSYMQGPYNNYYNIMHFKEPSIIMIKTDRHNYYFKQYLPIYNKRLTFLITRFHHIYCYTE